MELRPTINNPRDFSCHDCHIMTIIAWLRGNYEWMQCMSWHLELLNNDFVAGYKTGNQILTSSTNIYSLASKLYGVDFLLREDISKSEMLDIVKTETLAGRMVMIRVDPFYLPWHEFYNKSHIYHHFIILSSVNQSDNTIQCIDIYYPGEEKVIDFQTLQLGGHCCITYSVDNYTNEKNQAYFMKQKEEIYKNIAFIKLHCRDDTTRLAQKIRHIDLDREFANYEDIQFAPLIVQCLKLARGRKQFARFIAYADDMYEVPILSEFSKAIGSSGDAWSIVRSLLIKAYCSEDRVWLLDKISDKLCAVGELEKENADKLCNWLLTEKTEFSLLPNARSNQNINGSFVPVTPHQQDIIDLGTTLIYCYKNKLYSKFPSDSVNDYVIPFLISITDSSINSFSAATEVIPIACKCIALYILFIGKCESLISLHVNYSNGERDDLFNENKKESVDWPAGIMSISDKPCVFMIRGETSCENNIKSVTIKKNSDVTVMALTVQT